MCTVKKSHDNVCFIHEAVKIFGIFEAVLAPLTPAAREKKVLS